MATLRLGECSYNHKQQDRRKPINVLWCKIFLVMVLFFWLLFTHFDMVRALYEGVIAVSSKPLPIFIFMNSIIFALCFLTSQKPMIQPPHSVLDHENVDSAESDDGPDIDVRDSVHPDEELINGEMFIDKHVILLESVSREIVAVSSDKSTSFERNHHHELELRSLERRMSEGLVITMREPPWKTMDDMSNEEFRFAVEAFIADRNKVMMEENIHDHEEGLHFFISTSN